MRLLNNISVLARIYTIISIYIYIVHGRLCFHFAREPHGFDLVFFFLESEYPCRVSKLLYICINTFMHLLCATQFYTSSNVCATADKNLYICKKFTLGSCYQGSRRNISHGFVQTSNSISGVFYIYIFFFGFTLFVLCLCVCLSGSHA